MAITTSVYNSYKLGLLDGDIDHGSDAIKVALVNGYSVDVDSHDFFNDITNETSGTGYTAGGETLTSKTTTQDNTDNEGVFDAADVSWTSSSFSATGAVVYKSTGTAATSPLMYYIDFGGTITTSSSDLDLTWNSEGLINIT